MLARLALRLRDALGAADLELGGVHEAALTDDQYVAVSTARAAEPSRGHAAGDMARADMSGSDPGRGPSGGDLRRVGAADARSHAAPSAPRTRPGSDPGRVLTGRYSAREGRDRVGPRLRRERRDELARAAARCGAERRVAGEPLERGAQRCRRRPAATRKPLTPSSTSSCAAPDAVARDERRARRRRPRSAPSPTAPSATGSTNTSARRVLRDDARRGRAGRGSARARRRPRRSARLLACRRRRSRARPGTSRNAASSTSSPFSGSSRPT